jgi:hypothetical protein
MRISARADYAVRAVLELAVRQGDGDPVKAETVAAAQDITHTFLEGSSATCAAPASSTAGAVAEAATCRRGTPRRSRSRT